MQIRKLNDFFETHDDEYFAETVTEIVRTKACKTKHKKTIGSTRRDDYKYANFIYVYV